MTVGADKPYIGKEDNFQKATNDWLSVSGIFSEYEFFHIPNGGRRDGRTGAMMKRQGVQKGVSDWFISRPNKNHHGMYIELKVAKRDGNKVKLTYPSKEQKEFLAIQKANGYMTVVCYSFDSFTKVVYDYINDKI